ncbi:hypothetical protein [Pimelobacter simplex]|uniref:hypothetical protein n=1 Tax=Nocardioides simplex TaxID=2045 RepID=UPI003AAF4AA8
MVAVLVGGVGAVCGLLVGLAPYLFVSQRVRLLRLLAQERELLCATEDPVVMSDLLRAHRSSAEEYRELAADSLRPMRRLMFEVVVPGIVLVGLASFAGFIMEDGTARDVVQVVAIVGCALLIVILFSLFARSTDLKRRYEGRLASMRSAVEEAEGSRQAE